ncbi:MAG: rod shape-determining protein RodA [Flavobacterium sp.]
MIKQGLTNKIDWRLVFLYILIVTIGWLNIYSTSVNLNATSYDSSALYAKQLNFIVFSAVIAIAILNINHKIFERFSVFYYIIGLLSIIGLHFFGTEIKGQTNWYKIGPITIQPAEFAKTATALFFAKYLSDMQTKIERFKDQLISFVILGLPFLLLITEDAGSALIFLAFFIVLYREELPIIYAVIGFTMVSLFLLAIFINPIYIIFSILIVMIYLHFKSDRKHLSKKIFLFLLLSGYIYSVDYLYDNVLKEHHKDRINVLFSDNISRSSEGYNVDQSMITIGSGGFLGKGYMQGTQTIGGFVPEQSTDYIFTSIGEEWGFLGAFFVITIFVLLFLRIIFLAERQRTKFARIYGYCVASILFLHFFVNLTMLVKLFPTIGVPLPFLSYGGSSMLSFTILLFIFIKIDAHKYNDW